MNLLILLSALLSALGGMGQAVRSARASEVVCVSVVSAAAARVAAPEHVVRPSPALPPVAALPAVKAIAWTLAVIEPAFASRRRE